MKIIFISKINYENTLQKCVLHKIDKKDEYKSFYRNKIGKYKKYKICRTHYHHEFFEKDKRVG